MCSLSDDTLNLPKGWEVKGFEKCLEKVVYTKKIKRKEFLENGKYPVISQEQDLVNGYWNNLNDLFEIKKPVVVFGDHTQVIKYIDFNFVLGADGVKILQPKNEINSKYLFYYLKNINLDSLGYARHYRLLRKLEIRFPKSLPEQKRIVAILDQAFTAIAKAKTNAEQNLKNARELFQSKLQETFDNEEWEEKRIDQVTKVLNGHSFKSKDFSSENTVKSIKITNVGVKEFIETEDNYLPSSFSDTYNKYKVYKGNIVIALTRTIISSGLKVAVVPDEYNYALLNQRVAALIPKDVIDDYYLYHFFCTKIVSDYVLNNVNPLMQPNLSITDLKKLLIPCPPIEEQKEIAKNLDALTAQTKKLETIYQQKINDLDELKKSILQKAFNGEL